MIATGSQHRDRSIVSDEFDSKNLRLLWLDGAGLNHTNRVV